MHSRPRRLHAGHDKDAGVKSIFASLGSLVVGACCLGLAPLIAALSAVGLGFLIRDAVLIPLLVLMLGFTLWALWSSRAVHHLDAPMYLGLPSAVAAFAGLWLYVPLSWVGFIGLVGASIWDFVAGRAIAEPGEAPCE